ncbi:MAG TPA: NlpC/P60 family protein [Pseudonocardiaceae bacterium]|nr:NlpC/P60 family protein [Pseudonocardiaceae bacterium]
MSVVAAGFGTTVLLPAALLTTVVLTTSSGLTGGGCSGAGGPGGGAQRVDEKAFSAEQMTNANTIVSVTVNRRLPERAAVIAVTAALVESDLRNVAAGDRDSVGLLQERPSQGWGTPEDILNPAYATGTFLDHLIAVPNWPSLPPGAAEQDVERSAYPDRYAPEEPTATQLAARFWTTTPDAVGMLTADDTSAGCPDQGAADTPSIAVSLPENFALPPDPRQAAVVSYALAQIGKPYEWGAKGPNAFDCSGLVQAAWAAAGVALDAGTTSQVHDGNAVPGLDAVQPGDLLFTPGSLGSASNPRHVGLYIGHGLLINAYDTKTGVIVQQLSTWTGHVVVIRRPAPAAIS